MVGSAFMSVLQSELEYVREVGQTVGPTSGHLLSDQDGCQPGRNMVYDAASDVELDDLADLQTCASWSRCSG
jgi:hypothetical protein